MLALYLYLGIRKRRKRVENRKCWVSDINSKRLTLGAFHTLFFELRADDNKFFNYFRMSVTSFDELDAKLSPRLQRRNTDMRDCISPKEMLAVTIRYVFVNKFKNEINQNGWTFSLIRSPLSLTMNTSSSGGNVGFPNSNDDGEPIPGDERPDIPSRDDHAESRV